MSINTERRIKKGITIEITLSFSLRHGELIGGVGAAQSAEKERASAAGFDAWKGKGRWRQPVAFQVLCHNCCRSWKVLGIFS